ncbi:hypothetical protein QTP88_011428 [Uroleucon formosanum]
MDVRFHHQFRLNLQLTHLALQIALTSVIENLKLIQVESYLEINEIKKSKIKPRRKDEKERIQFTFEAWNETLYILVLVMWHRSVGLTMRKMCGELECPEYYMCQSHDLQCYPCHSYCNQKSHNFDVNICERHCQDYIHDYIKHYVKAGEIQDSFQEQEILKFMMICVVVLIIITVILIAIMTVIICNRKRFVWTTENGENEENVSYLKEKMAISKDNAVSTVNETVDKQTMMQSNHMTASSSNKFPCEDITLETQDFTGYDNPLMRKVSPDPEFCSKL